MIDITSFLLKHLYELMADNYNAANQDHNQSCLQRYPTHLQQDQQLEDLAAVTSEAEPTSSETTTTTNQVTTDCNTTTETNKTNTTKKGADLKHATIAANSQHHTQVSSDKTTTTTSSDDNNHNISSSQSSSSTAATRSLSATLQRHFYHCRLYQWQRQRHQSQQQQLVTRNLLAREQETNQQIVSFLINNQLPDLACETLIELIFICVFLAVSWIFVMIIQLHCHQTTTIPNLTTTTTTNPDLNLTPSAWNTRTTAPVHETYSHARDYYCNTKFLNSLMYCNNRDSKAYSS